MCVVCVCVSNDFVRTIAVFVHIAIASIALLSVIGAQPIATLAMLRNFIAAMTLLF